MERPCLQGTAETAAALVGRKTATLAFEPLGVGAG